MLGKKIKKKNKKINQPMIFWNIFPENMVSRFMQIIALEDNFPRT